MTRFMNAAAVVLLLAASGCATDVTRRGAIGNPEVARMSPEELARSTSNLPAVPSTEDIVRLSRSGVAPAQIIERTKAGGGPYPLAAEEIAALRARGVDQAVLDHLVAAERAAQAGRGGRGGIGAWGAPRRRDAPTLAALRAAGLRISARAPPRATCGAPEIAG